MLGYRCVPALTSLTLCLARRGAQAWLCPQPSPSMSMGPAQRKLYVPTLVLTGLVAEHPLGGRLLISLPAKLVLYCVWLSSTWVAVSTGGCEHVCVVTCALYILLHPCLLFTFRAQQLCPLYRWKEKVKRELELEFQHRATQERAEPGVLQLPNSGSQHLLDHLENS